MSPIPPKSYEALVFGSVPHDLVKAFIVQQHDESKPPPPKKAKVAPTPQERAAKALPDYLTLSRFILNLKFESGCDTKTEEQPCELLTDIPIHSFTLEDAAVLGAEDESALFLAIFPPRNGKLVPLFDRSLEGCHDFPLRYLTIASIYRISGEPYAVSMHTLARDPMDERRFVLDCRILIRNTPVVHRNLRPELACHINAYFPGLPAPLREETVTPQEFYQTVPATTEGEDLSNIITSSSLECTLFPFQQRAVRWLLERENVDIARGGTIYPHDEPPEPSLPLSYHATTDADGRPCYSSPLLRVLTTELPECSPPETSLQGGILCEEMGLGKTVEILALICLNQPQFHPQVDLEPFNDQHGRSLIESRATIIITPPSILEQWTEELQRHAPSLYVIHYKGHSNKLADPEELINELAAADVVLTTYPVLQSEMHFAVDPPERNLRRPKEKNTRKSPLVEVLWWRVCLDEAQMVESGTSHAAQVARLLPRQNAWAITGTPLKKDLNDLYGLLLFLQYEPLSHSSEIFQRLCAMFKPLFKDTMQKIALRHSKDVIRNELQLPRQRRLVIRVPFTALEQQHYDRLRRQMCVACGVDASGAPVSEHWDPHNPRIVSMMRRWLSMLRQACLHPHICPRGYDGGDGSLELASDGRLRTIAEVIDAIIEATRSELRAETKLLLQALLRRIQIFECYKMTADALRMARRLRYLLEKLVHQFRTILKGATEKSQREKEAAAAAAATEKEASNARNQHPDAGSAPDSSSEEATGRNHSSRKKRKDRKRGAKKKQSPVAVARAQLRTHLEYLHMVYFFMGNGFYNSKQCVPENRGIDYAFYEHLEDHAYAEAKKLRDELLRDITVETLAWLKYLESRLLTKGLVWIPQITAEFPQKLLHWRHFDSLISVCSAMNEHAALDTTWRAELVRLLLKPLDHNSGDGGGDGSEESDLPGNEYETAAKIQDDAFVYMEVLQAMQVSREYVLTARDNVSFFRGIQDKIRYADPDLTSPLYVVMMKRVLGLRLNSRLHFPTNAITNLCTLNTAAHNEAGKLRTIAGHNREGTAFSALASQVNYILTEQTKCNQELEYELRVFNEILNSRIQYYQQLQHLSDSVAPFVTKTGDRRKDLRKNQVESQRAQDRISRLHSNCRFFRCLRDESLEDDDSRMCIICRCPFETGVLTVCGHKYCRACIDKWWTMSDKCPMCKHRLDNRDFHPISFKPMKLVAHEEETPLEEESGQKAGNPIYSNLHTDIYNEIMDVQLPLAYGTKIDTLAKHIIWLRKHDPGAKSVVYSQYRAFIKGLAGAFDNFNIGYCLADNKTTASTFKSSPDKECFLLHGKAQASGLNLVCASHVFLCEPLVNTAIELQTIARIHRIGQTRETTIWMYLITDSVEESVYEVSVARRMEHITRKREKERDCERGSSADDDDKGTNSVAEGEAADGKLLLTEHDIDAGNSLELQTLPTDQMMEKNVEIGGERVPEDCLWGCLFNKPRISGNGP